MKHQSPNPLPISYRNLVQWIKRTIWAEGKGSINKAILLRRLLSSLFQNLNDPIFLIGSPRSGTTFLGNCLGTLPEVSYYSEPIVIKAATRYVYEGFWKFKKAQWFYYNIYRFLLCINSNERLRFCEKTPRNSLIVPFLSRSFPRVQFIHIIRDGRDCTVSHSKKPWFQAAMVDSGRREPGGYLYGPFARFWVEPHRRNEFEKTSDLHRCIWNWRVYNQHALAAAKKLSKKRYLQVRYELLANNPDHESQRILNFLNISSPTSCALFIGAMKNARSDSIGRWRTELSPLQIETVQKEAGHLLRDLGYGNYAVKV